MAMAKKRKAKRTTVRRTVKSRPRKQSSSDLSSLAASLLDQVEKHREHAKREANRLMLAEPRTTATFSIDDVARLAASVLGQDETAGQD